MKPKDFCDQVANLPALAGLGLEAADVRRVLSGGFLVLSNMEPVECCDTIARAMVEARNAAKKMAHVSGPSEDSNNG